MEKEVFRYPVTAKLQSLSGFTGGGKSHIMLHGMLVAVLQTSRDDNRRVSMDSIIWMHFK